MNRRWRPEPARHRPDPAYADRGGRHELLVAGASSAVRRVGRLRPAPYSLMEWELLTRLPGRIVVAAVSAGPVDAHRAVAEGMAGIAGIAAGLAFDSDLVRAIVAAIYAEPDHPGPESDHPGAGPGAAGTRAAIRAEVLSSCRTAVRVLSVCTDPADSAIYRQWLQSLAVRVRRAARVAGPLWVGVLPSPAEERFPAELGEALGLG